MSNPPLHILFTTAWYPTRLDETNGVFIEKHARAVAMNNQVSVLVVKPDYALRGLHIDIETAASNNLTEVRVFVPKVRFEIPLLTGILRFILYLLGSIKGYRYIRKHVGRIDISHVNVLTRAGVLPFLLKQIYEIPYVITEHWTRYHNGQFPRSGIQLYLTRLLVKNAAMVFPVSKNLQLAMQSHGLKNNHYSIVNNVVDTAIFKPSHPKSENSKKQIIHVSLFRDEAKNITGILDVIARLAGERDDFELVLIGEGPDKDRIRAKAIALGIADKYVFFKDFMTKQDLAQNIQCADFMLMFSNYENQPVAILESLACGVPVVATAVGDIPSMLAEQRGITVAPKDQVGLYSAINQMLDHFQEYDREALSEYIFDNYSYQRVSQVYNCYYHSILNN